jgi:hypothetical protein
MLPDFMYFVGRTRRDYSPNPFFKRVAWLSLRFWSRWNPSKYPYFDLLKLNTVHILSMTIMRQDMHGVSL